MCCHGQAYTTHSHQQQQMGVLLGVKAGCKALTYVSTCGPEDMHRLVPGIPRSLMTSILPKLLTDANIQPACRVASMMRNEQVPGGRRLLCWLSRRQVAVLVLASARDTVPKDEPLLDLYSARFAGGLGR